MRDGGGGVDAYRKGEIRVCSVILLSRRYREPKHRPIPCALTADQAADVHSSIGEPIARPGDPAVDYRRMAVGGVIYHSTRYLRATRRDNSAVLYFKDGIVNAGAIKTFLRFRDNLFVTVCAIALSSTQSRTVVGSDMLQERFLCGHFLPSVHHTVLCKDVLEKCVCIVSGEWVYLIRFPNKLCVD